MSNPLSTVVILDDGDRWMLREVMQEDHGPSEDDAWLNDLHSAYEDALKDEHVGDCTCVPCSCLKCHAERYLGIRTLAGLTKHTARKVSAAFGGGRTIDEAIAALASFDPKPSSSWAGKEELWNAHLPRWRDEAHRAHAWLVRYRAERLSVRDEPPPETIEAAAIRYMDAVYTVPRPGRHHDVCRVMSQAGLPTDSMRDQGFVTSTGRFVDRREGCLIATTAAQVRVKTGPSHLLFSEDLW